MGKRTKGKSSATPDRATTVVRARGLGRRFGANEVLRGVDVEIRSGEVVGLVGPNGGGKTTLLLLFAGLLKPTNGTVTVCDIKAHELAQASAGLVGLVTARPGLYPLLTGWENLEYFAGLFGLSATDARSRAALMLISLGLRESDMQRRVETWSSGMQQKLSLVRALLLSPKLLLFDEPTANLDPISAQALFAELRARADAGLACVLVTHDLVSAETLCDRVLLIAGGIRKEIPFAKRTAPQPGPLLQAWEHLGDG